MLEAKLHTQLQKKSQILLDIENLKKEINHYRKLRIQTDISHGKLVESLEDYRSKIEIMLSESTYILEQRESLIQAKDNLERINIEEQQAMQAEYESMVDQINYSFFPFSFVCVGVLYFTTE